MVIKNATIQKVVQDLLGKDNITKEDILSIKELGRVPTIQSCPKKGSIRPSPSLSQAFLICWHGFHLY